MQQNLTAEQRQRIEEHLAKVKAGKQAKPEKPEPRGWVDENDPLVDEIEQLLRQLVVNYEQLLSLAELHLEAIRKADVDQLATCIGQENRIIQRVAEIEKRRLHVVGDLADVLGSPDETQTTMSWIAERIRGERGGRLAAMARHLREVIGRMTVINESARSAAETLAKHMDGLMRSVARELNHAKTYSSRGRVDAGPAVVSGLDISS
ncbi:MAG: flagellar protein FlgN [Phycisphaerales bacterium]|jgi:hypothetical protein